MKDEPQKIYDSEINVRIDNFWDAGWQVALLLDGEVVRRDWDFCNLDDVVPALTRRHNRVGSNQRRT